MPYNTRRKSLSLPSLGIHLPNASRSHRSPSASKSSASGSTILDEQVPPSKKVKRSHDVADSSTSTDKSQKVATGRIRNSRGTYEHTPPPSPGDAIGVSMKIDTEGINDDVVVAAIEQLEKTGNKPHLVRELAAVLVKVNDTVANSANPAALLSSRLNTYMKRPWTALSPCPIGKELINVHPRKVFYYLTTTPHQPLPENLEDMVAMDEKRLTPSLSSGSVDQDDDDAMARERSRLSPSPEIDLSSPEFEEEHDTFNARHSSGSHTNHNNSHHRLSHNHRAASPPLEGDEREFTQTASSLRERASEEKASRQSSLAALSMPTSDDPQEAQIHAFPGSPMDEDPLSTSISENNQYEDYLLPGGSRDQEQDLDDAAVATLFGTSPSPSLTSVATSLSSGTTATSEAELADVPFALPTSDLARSDTATATEDNSTSSPSLKRSFDMVATGFPTKSVMDLKQSQTFDFEMVIDSWADLRSPETVEVDELDEMFGDF